MIHVSGNKLAIDKNEVEWSFPEINDTPEIVNKTVASEEGTYNRSLVSGIQSLIGYDLSGVTISFNPNARYGGSIGDNLFNISTVAIFRTSGGYQLVVGGPPNVEVRDNSGTSLFTFYTYDMGGTLGTTSTGSYNYTFPNDTGVITKVKCDPYSDTYMYHYTDEEVSGTLRQLITGSAELLARLNTQQYNSYNALTDNNVGSSTTESVTTYSTRYARVSLNSSSSVYSNNKLVVGLPSCPTVSSFATDNAYCNKLISHYYSTSIISNINTTNYLANAEYGLTVSSSTTNLPINVTTTTRIHLKNKNFYYYTKSTSYPYIVQELTYLDSTNKGRKFERVINYKSSTASSCEWGTWYETTANKLVLTDSSQTITGNKTYLGVNNFGTTTSFQYGGIGNGTANANSHVWFSNDTTVGRPVKNDNFKYNPATQQLQVGTSNNASVQLSECTLQYNSSSKSLSFNFN